MSPRLFLAAALLLAPALAHAEIRVVASFAPVHSLVAGVMDGVGEPVLLVPGGASPHDYALKPSQAAELEKATVVFRIGHELEAFMDRPLETLAQKARVVDLIDADGVKLLAPREGGTFEAHADEADHDDGHDEVDPHVWLDPQNAKAMIGAIERALAEADPPHAERYTANAHIMLDRLETLQAEIATRLAPIKDRPFVVFHDAYHYFENRFGLHAAGAITVNPEQAPGAARVAEIRAKVAELGAVCVFSEPQFEPKLVSVIVEGTGAKTGVLDPEGGGTLVPGPDLYFALLDNMAVSLTGCLASP